MEELTLLFLLLALVVGVPAAFYGALQVIAPESSHQPSPVHERRIGQFSLGQLQIWTG